MKTIETYQKAEQNPLGICDQQSNVPQRHFYHLVVVRLLVKGLRKEPEPRGMIRSEKSCKEVIMTFIFSTEGNAKTFFKIMRETGFCQPRDGTGNQRQAPGS